MLVVCSLRGFAFVLCAGVLFYIIYCFHGVCFRLLNEVVYFPFFCVGGRLAIVSEVSPNIDELRTRTKWVDDDMRDVMRAKVQRGCVRADFHLSGPWWGANGEWNILAAPGPGINVYFEPSWRGQGARDEIRTLAVPGTLANQWFLPSGRGHGVHN